MPSSTSSSDCRSDNPYVVAFLVMAALLVVATELATRFVISPGSTIQRRVETERRAAAALRPASGGQARTVLLVGNSLLLHSVDMDLLNRQLLPDARGHRFVIEATSYWDWYFGLQRLFDEGCRPDQVVVLLSPRQMISNDIRNEYFAYYLMRARDIVPVTTSASLHPTVASQLLFARLSLFYGIRNEVRKHLLSRLLPGLEQFAAMLTASAGTPPPPPDAEPRLHTRLDGLQKLSAQYSVPIAVVVPPSGTSAAIRAYDAIIARLMAGTPFLLAALPSSETARADYFDGFHTNARGRERHTLRLAEALRTCVQRPPQRAQRAANILK
jgi:hypothetical protein